MDVTSLACVLVLFIISAVAQSSPEDVENINTFLDDLIESAKISLKEANRDSINIPDLEQPIRKKIAFIKVSGGVKATGGVLTNLTTLERTGNAKLDLYDDKAVLIVFLGFQTLELDFNHFRVWLGKLSISERLKVIVGQNSINVQISLFDDGQTCNVQLDHIKINELGSIKLVVKGLGVLNKIVKDVENMIMNHLKTQICSLVEKELYNYLSKELKKLNLCEILL